MARRFPLQAWSLVSGRLLRSWRGFRRGFRRTRRRLVPALIALILCFSVTAQQTQAVPILMTTQIPFRPYVGPTFSQLVGAYARMMARSLSKFLPGFLFASGGSAPSPAAPTGMPNPWQAADPAGPYSVVNLSNGTLFSRLRIVGWDGIDFTLYHSAGNPSANIGGNWSHSYCDTLHVSGSSAAYYTADGREIDFTISSGQAENMIYRLKLSYNSTADEWTITRADQSKLVFKNGQLQRVVDSSGNETTMHYTSGLLDTVTDPASRVLTLSYTSGRLTGINAPKLTKWNGTSFDDVNRNWTLTYDSVRHVLTHVTNARGIQNSFTYTSLIFLATATDFEGNTWNYYYTSDRCTKCKHPAVADYVAGGSPRAERNYTYTVSSGQVTKAVVNDERSQSWEYNFDGGGRLTSTKDPLNRTTATIEWNSNNRPCSITNVLGGETTITYHSDGNTDTVTTPRGETTTNFDSLNNLTAITDALSQTTAYTYSTTSVNPTRVTQINGPGSADTANFVWGTGTGSGGNGTPKGLIASMTDPNSAQQRVEYDSNRNVDRTWFGVTSNHEDGCSETGDALLGNNITGEVQIPGHAAECTATTGCGCKKSYDGEGNITKFSCQCDSSCNGRHDPPEGGSCTQVEITYDGNNRLTFAPYSECDDEHGLHFQYDPRGRQKMYKADSITGSGDYFQIDRSFSDSHGSWKVTNSHVFSTSDQLIVVHEYKTDAAGRVSEVWRQRGGGSSTKVLSYTYHDAQTSWNVRETREGRGYTDYYLDTDGAIREVAHYNVSDQLLASYTYTRDALGRITHVDESRWDSVGEVFLDADTDYTYGSGTLSSGDLDSSSTVNLNKLHYSWLADLAGGFALQSGDPNRLVKERRYSSDSTMGSYKKEYWYDPGGNRLSMRESTPASSEANDTVTAITRYNYWFMPITDFAGTLNRPFKPDGPSNWYSDSFAYPDETTLVTSVGTNYAGCGQNKLISKEVLHPGDQTHASATRYEYGSGVYAGGDPFNWNYAAVTARVNQEASRADENANWTDAGSSTMACDYDKDMEMLHAGPETYRYDIFARRSYRETSLRAYVMEYDGQQVVAENYDRTLYATYTLGAFGPAIRTDCNGNYDTSDDHDAYYLWDGSGNSVGMMLYDDTTESWQAVFQVHDAFGNLIAPNSSAANAGAAYAWRGAEGSETEVGYGTNDAGTGLVYMQARYYDPEIGRFLRADDLPIASMTTQGLNRYVYCENDPVNLSDPTGTFPLAIAFLASYYSGVLDGVMYELFGDPLGLGIGSTGAGTLAAALASLLAAAAAATCLLAYNLWLVANLSGNPVSFLAALIGILMRGNALRFLAAAGPRAGLIGVVLLIGYIMGFIVGASLVSTRGRPSVPSDDEPGEFLAALGCWKAENCRDVPLTPARAIT